MSFCVIAISDLYQLRCVYFGLAVIKVNLSSWHDIHLPLGLDLASITMYAHAMAKLCPILCIDYWYLLYKL